MQKIAFILLICVFLVSCKSAKSPKIVTKKSDQSKSTTVKRKIINEETVNYDVISNIVNSAKEYNGVRYRYGGTTSKGMDCSGLICTVFNSENIKLPRTSLAMSKEGSIIDLNNVQKGDLLFFQTNKNKKQVNHVGLVVEALPGLVEFIHSTSSKGVIISNLNQSYWSLAFFQARRIL